MKTLLVMLIVFVGVPAWAAETIVIHSAKTGQVVVRDRTAQEQAAVDAQRNIPATAKQPTLQAVIDALKAKALLTDADILAQVK